MYRLAAVMILLGSAASAQETDYRAILFDTIKAEDCTLLVPEEARGAGFEEWFSEKLAATSDIPVEDWIDRDGPHFDGMDDAMEDAADEGLLEMDRETFTITLTECA